MEAPRRPEVKAQPTLVPNPREEVLSLAPRHLERASAELSAEVLGRVALQDLRSGRGHKPHSLMKRGRAQIVPEDLHFG